MTLSRDIRGRIVASSKAGEGSVRALAKRFCVGISSVQRLITRERQTGSIDPQRPGGGGKPLIPDRMLPELVSLVKEKPDRTTTELRVEWLSRTGIEVSHGTMIRSLKRCNLTFKKNFSSGRTRFGKEPRKAASI